MEWWQFGLDVVRVLIWPALILTLVLYIGQDELRAFIRRLRKGSVLGASVELDQAVEAAQRSIEAQPEEVAQAITAQVNEDVQEALEDTESETVRAGRAIQLWREIERLLETAGGKRTVGQNIAALRPAVRDVDLFVTLDELRAARNRLVHEEVALGQSDYVKFVRGASFVRARLEGILDLQERIRRGDVPGSAAGELPLP